MGNYAISILREETKTRVILWTAGGVQTALMDVPQSETMQVTDVMKRLGWNMSKKKLKEMKKGESIENPGVSLSWTSTTSGTMSGTYPIGKWEMEMVKLESKVASRFGTYKFGILYVKDGQKKEEEMFSNRKSSMAFKEFCLMMGDKIELKEWPFFSGGLDTKSDRTGRASIYTQHSGYEIMFHVSTMLPWNDSDFQQIDRKRHIGNDVVIIVFVDEDVKDSWSPSSIAARFPHIYAIVKPWTNPVDGSTSWLLNICSKDPVSYFGPPLPQPPLFTDPSSFRLFLLSKLINGEREAIKTVSDFRQNNAYLSDLQDLYERVSKENKNSEASPSAKDSSKTTNSYETRSTASGGATSNSSIVSFAADSSEPDSIASLGSNLTSPRTLGSARNLGKSSPSLFAGSASSGTPLGGTGSSPFYNSSSSTHPHHLISRGEYQFGGSLTGISGHTSSRDLRAGMASSNILSHSSQSTSSRALTGHSSANTTTTNNSATNSPTVPFIAPLSVSLTPSSSQDSLRRSIQQSLPPSMLATTEQLQAFQNRPTVQNFPTEITCAADGWDGLTIIGTIDGLFVLDQSAFGDAKIHETKCVVHKNQPYKRNHYLQLTVIEELNILLALISKVGVVMYDLGSLLNFQNNSPAPELLIAKSKGATLFSLGTYSDVLHLAISIPKGIVIHHWQSDSFVISQFLPLSPPPLTMEFDSKGYIIAAGPTEFYAIKPDPDSPTMNTLASWSEKEKDRGMEPVALLLFEDSGEYLLCFESIGYFVNTAGQKTRNFEFRWFSRPVSVVSVYPYLLVFTKQHMEIRYLANGSLCQLFELDSKLESSMRFMSAFNGIRVATISHLHTGLASSNHPLSSSSVISKEQKSNSEKTTDLTSSSGSSNTTPVASPPNSISGTTINVALASGNATNPNSNFERPSISPSASGGSLAMPSPTHGLSANGGSGATSTIHTLRLNTAQTCLVSNPQMLAQGSAGNPSFVVLGVPSTFAPLSSSGAVPGQNLFSSPTPPISIPPSYSSASTQALPLGSARRNYAARKSGGVVPSASGSNLGEFSAGSSPHSPASSLLQQHYLSNEGTASVDDSDDVYRSGSALLGIAPRENSHFAGDDSPATAALYHRRKSPGRDSQNRNSTNAGMTIGSLGSNMSSGSSGADFISKLESGRSSTPTGVDRASLQHTALVYGVGSKSSSPARGGGRVFVADDAGSRDLNTTSSPSPTSRLSSSAKISRRKSLVFDDDLASPGLRKRRGAAEKDYKTENRSSATGSSNSRSGTTPSYSNASHAQLYGGNNSNFGGSGGGASNQNSNATSSPSSATAAAGSSSQVSDYPPLYHLQIHARDSAALYQMGRTSSSSTTGARSRGSFYSPDSFDFDPDYVSGEGEEDDVAVVEAAAKNSDTSKKRDINHSSLASQASVFKHAKGRRNRLVDEEDEDFEDEGDEEEAESTSTTTTEELLPSTAVLNSPGGGTRVKKGRTASDKLSGSSERSPRTSPVPSAGLLKDFSENRKSRKIREGSNSSGGSTNSSSNKQAVRSGSDIYLHSTTEGSAPQSSFSAALAGTSQSTIITGSPPSPTISRTSYQQQTMIAQQQTAAASPSKSSKRLSSKSKRKSLGAALTSSELVAAGIAPSDSLQVNATARSIEVQNANQSLSQRKPSPGRKSPSRSSSAASTTSFNATSTQIAASSDLLSALQLSHSENPSQRSPSPSRPSQTASKPRATPSSRSLARTAIAEVDSASGGSAGSSPVIEFGTNMPISPASAAIASSKASKSRHSSATVSGASSSTKKSKNASNTSGSKSPEKVSGRGVVTSASSSSVRSSGNQHYAGNDLGDHTFPMETSTTVDTMATSSESPMTPRKTISQSILFPPPSSSSTIAIPHSPTSSSKKDRRKSEKKSDKISGDSPKPERRRDKEKDL